MGLYIWATKQRNIIGNTKKNLLKIFYSREFHILYRKIFIMIISQLLPLDPQSKALSVLGILACSFYIQNLEDPFMNRKMNQFENHSVLLILATIYFGFWNTLQENYQFKNFFISIFYIFNIGFYIYWIYEIWLKPWIWKVESKKRIQKFKNTVNEEIKPHANKHNRHAKEDTREDECKRTRERKSALPATGHEQSLKRVSKVIFKRPVEHIDN